MISSWDENGFWRDACRIRGSVTPRALPCVLLFGVYSALICVLAWIIEYAFSVRIGLEIAPFEFAGTALGLLLILRTNAGYDRWWEARKLWGGIVNQTRNLVVTSFAYGPTSADWRNRLVCWTMVFPHVARCSLRGEAPDAKVTELIGPDAAAQLAAADHMPSFVALELARLLREGCDHHGLDRFAFLQADKERAMLIDHIGACERILKTPLPLVYAIKIRRFLALFLLTIPLALLHRTASDWLIPVVTIMVAYPLIALDQIGVELQNPYARSNLSHLPLNDICLTIEQNLKGLLESLPPEAACAENHAMTNGSTALPVMPPQQDHATGAVG